MGSFKSKGRNQGPNRRRGKASPGRQGFPRIESLEEQAPADRRRRRHTHAALDADLHESRSTPRTARWPTWASGLVNVYAAYLQDGDNAANLQAEFPQVQFQNGMVGVQLKSLGGDFSQYLSQLTNVGMQVTTSSSYYGLVEGYAPINELPTIAELAQTQSGIANYEAGTSAAELPGRRQQRGRDLDCSPTSRGPSSTSTAPA